MTKFRKRIFEFTNKKALFRKKNHCLAISIYNEKRSARAAAPFLWLCPFGLRWEWERGVVVGRSVASASGNTHAAALYFCEGNETGQRRAAICLPLLEAEPPEEGRGEGWIWGKRSPLMAPLGMLVVM